MSEINTNGMNVNYPIPGINNSTQGFRDNFSSIKTNIDTAGAEISELQQKVILKTALSSSTINNDMSGTLISNASVRGFRTTTYNLGNDISGIKTIDVTKADVQYGTITGNTTLQFGGWSPSGTQSNVQLLLTVANSNAYITFPDTVCQYDSSINTGMKASARLLENYTSNGSPGSSVTYTNKVSVPNNVSVLHYEFSTENCGSTIEVAPINRNQKANQITSRTPTIANIASTSTITCTTGSNVVTGTGFLTDLVVNMTILNSSNVVIGTVESIANNTSATLTANALVAVANNSYNRRIAIGNVGDTQGTICSDSTYLYVCTGNYDGSTAIWKKITLVSI